MMTTTNQAAEPKMMQFTCADCGQVTATYNANDAADEKRASDATWKHSCKQQRAANRKAARARKAVR